MAIKNFLNSILSRLFARIYFLKIRDAIIHRRNKLSKGQPPRHVLIACMPKCGSTFVSKIIAETYGLDYGFFAGPGKEIEYDIEETFILDRYFDPYVIHQHVRGIDANVKIVKELGITTFVLTRSIPDVIVSFYDHLHNEHTTWPMLYVAKEVFFTLDERTKYDQIIDFLTPWLFNFYVSWKEASKKEYPELVFLTYEEMLEDKASFFDKVFNAIPFKKAELSASSEAELYEKVKGKSRFNKGRTGRGKEILSEAQINRIKGFARYYPSYDFSPLGI